ncbi:hypothetical protein [Caldisericum sp.]|uniref:hypothetical protein n=1 Tax=Caldisericum sp. TaxID=2499687 RepID=UPI003D1179C5
MTPIEIVYSIRLLLDDSRDWYFPNIYWAINQAQMEFVRKSYVAQDEFALRLLYAFDKDLDNGQLIGETNFAGVRVKDRAKLLYPRACFTYLKDPRSFTKVIIDGTFTSATYQDIGEFNKTLAFPTIPYDPSLIIRTEYPKQNIYTIVSEPVMQESYRIYFNKQAPNQRAILYYIRRPETFFIKIEGNTIVDAQGLEIPNLYHAEVVGRAAEILNNQDVSEVDRGDFFNVYTGDRKLTIENVLSVMKPQGG